ncbi:zinc chelation protein SecC [Microbulbifer flavimaris]|uniref:Zinc chelation protein SecC n=1 Tax=Microbulbifer flavimaris TaxID=1781068 RepID=A0ABX4I3W4_9GAMM|nr:MULTISPECIES: SEC-C metal-binding domain-containing protein [Microbulbifer]PCO06868.1 zinc chelation protein SecC [Microbulbifer flavimaris]
MPQETDQSLNRQTQNDDSCCSNESCCPSQSPITRIGPKVGRNDPCPCGNGRKFKKCCGKNM